MTRARCHIYLTADYGLNALLFAGFVKCYRAVHDSVVCKGAGSMTRTFCSSRYLRNTAGAVKQAVFAVQMKMYEIRHLGAPFVFFAISAAWGACYYFKIQLLFSRSSISCASSVILSSLCFTPDFVMGTLCIRASSVRVA